MDNLSFRIDDGVLKKKPLTRANTILTPTDRLWNMTQALRPKPQTCCTDNLQRQTSLDYPFFSNKSPAKNVLNYDWIWADRLQKTQANNTPWGKSYSVAAIYEPQLLSPKTAYAGSYHPPQKPWPGRYNWWWHPAFQKWFAITCAFFLTVLIMLLLRKLNTSKIKLT